jgi:PAS domain S-box-containing protein
MAQESKLSQLGKWTGRLWSLVPLGGSLPQDVWWRRHRFLVGLTWSHAIAIALVGPVLGYRWEVSFSALSQNGTVLHTIGAGLIVACFALIADWNGARRAVQATAVGFGLMISSAILVHLSGGAVEVHFHLFVMLTFLALYQDWVPYLLAIAYVAIYHGVVGVLWPEAVYNHAAAVAAPWNWAGIDAFFVLWASAGSIIAWRFNEAAMAQSKLILHSVGDGIYGLDAEGKITFANPAAAKMVGSEDRDVVGEPIDQVVGGVTPDGGSFSNVAAAILSSLRSGTSFQGTDELFWRKDGTNFLVDYVSNPIFQRDQLVGAVVAFRDVTRRKRAAQELQARYRELAILHEVSQLVFGSTNLNAVMEKILERALSVVSLDLANIRLFDPSGRMQTGAYRGYRDRENIRKHYARMSGLDGGAFVPRVVASRKSLVVEDVAAAEGMRTFKREGVRSAIVVPILTAEETLGVIEIGSRAPHTFRSDEIRLLEAIGGQLGIAVQKARLFEETERHAREQEALNAIAMATSQSLHFDQTLQAALDKVLEVTGREQGYIRLKDPITANLSLAAHRGISEAYVQTLLHERTPGGKSERVFQSGEPLVINDPDVSTLKEQTRREGSRAFVWVPLKVRGRTVGIMNVATTRPVPFPAREVDLLQAIGNIIGVALENARLFEETERQNRELQSLYTIASTVAQSLDLDALMQIALKTTIEILGVDAGRLYVLDPNDSVLCLAAHHGIPAEYVARIERYQPGQGIVGKIFSGSRPIVFPDITIDPNYAAAARSQMGKDLGFRSAVGLPITVKDRAIGVIYVYGKTVREFTARDIELLSTIGGQIGFAIENARLFEELATKAEELARSNSELQHFAYVASHDLQEPLRMVASYVELLARRYKGKLDADADEFIAFAVDGATRMQALINALLVYSRVGTRAKEFEPTDCETLLDSTLAGLKAAIEESGASITRDPLPTIMADGTQLGQLFQNLIGNAIKFRNHKPPEIHVSAKRSGKEWLFTVSDNGIGFDSQYAERIFVMFQRLHAKGEYPGTGIGLAICKKIVERHGGQIRVESKPGEGATFYFTIPQ